MKLNNLLLLTLIAFSGCSILNPYNENFKCNIGAGEGICGSMSQNYSKINNNFDSNQTIVVDRLNDDQDCCFDQEIEALWINQKRLDNQMQEHRYILRNLK